jgi:dienelactone hydrolase
VIAAYDYLAALDTTDPARIGACGASYGAYLTALLSADRPLKRLLLRAPALASDVHFPASGTSSRPRNESEAFDSLAAISRYTGQVLVLESELDCRIPHSHITAYLKACQRAEHEVIPGARHTLDDPAWNEAFIQAIIRWFRDL